jgi:hypothetical protein
LTESFPPIFKKGILSSRLNFTTRYLTIRSTLMNFLERRYSRWQVTFRSRYIFLKKNIIHTQMLVHTQSHYEYTITRKHDCYLAFPWRFFWRGLGQVIYLSIIWLSKRKRPASSPSPSVTQKQDAPVAVGLLLHAHGTKRSKPC